MSSDSDSEDYSFQNEEMSQNSLESSQNMANVTFVGEDDQPLDFNALPQDENSPEFNWAAAQALKKNLNVTFEKHVDQAFNVKAKIQAFESKSKNTSTKISRDGRRPLKPCNQSLPISRPPTVPVAPSTKKVDGTLLSVYIRLRPPTASKDAIEKQEDALENTVEVISNARNAPSTRIRTYPPLYSNASKVVRSKHHLHSQSSNKDLIFDESSTASNSALDCAVKGVKEFEFNQVFDQTTDQTKVYQEVAFPLVDGMFPKNYSIDDNQIVGESALLFSYGITNAGKTHTIMGSNSNATSLDENHGIIPRSIDHILTRIKELKKIPDRRIKYTLYLSYLEIYNEQIYDLLPEKKPFGVDLGVEHSLKLREDRNGKIHIKGLKRYHVISLAEGLRLCQEAKKKRHTSSNNINSDSSRSHSICQFELIASLSDINNNFENESVATSISEYGTDDESVISNAFRKKSVTLWVVDLAGSERSKRTGNFSRSMRQKEAALINSSLMKLMRCLQTLRDNQNSSNSSVVPFRESKLTHLFMGHLTGSSASRTSMIVNVNPAAADFDETQHVLSYATAAKSVRIDKTEFFKIRQKIQKGDPEGLLHTHDDNGRRIGQTASPPRKLSKLVEKLSPRAALARRREYREAEAKKKQETAPLIGNHKKKLVGSKRKLEDENSELNAALEAAVKECSKLSAEVDFLRKKIETCESTIRKELSEEMENQIHFTQVQHDEIVRRLKQQIHSSQSVSQSAKKARRDKAEEIIEQYMDKVDECEEEIDRLKQEQEETISKLERDFLRKLDEKDTELLSLKVEIEEKDEEIARLREELNFSESYDYNERAQSLESDANEEVLQSPNSNEKSMTANHSATPSSATPRTRRLPRRRCSEVACTNISPTKDEPISSSKKRGLKLATSKFNALQKLASPPLKPSSIEDDLIFPSSQPEYDEDRKLYIRPRGRAPTGRRWDAKRGAWKAIS